MGEEKRERQTERIPCICIAIVAIRDDAFEILC